jgi:hypothetical protein
MMQAGFHNATIQSSKPVGKSIFWQLLPRGVVSSGRFQLEHDGSLVHRMSACAY